MNTPMPFPEDATGPEPAPEDVARGMSELEHYLAGQDRPSTEDPVAGPAALTGLDSDVPDSDLSEPDVGQSQVTEPPVAETAVIEPAVIEPAVTERVRRLAAQVREAHALLSLQDDDAPLRVDTPKVRRRRLAGAQAARLHALARHPATLAWQAARWRLVLTVAAVVALLLALGWSTAGVQTFAAEGARPWSPAWLFAWLVEPFLSLALLVTVAARAFMATRGQPLNDPVLRRVEGLFLGLTLGMNAWPHLPLVAHPFTVSGLVLHLLGPIVAVAIVTALPVIWRAFADLDHHGTARTETDADPDTVITGGSFPEPIPNAHSPHSPRANSHPRGGRPGRGVDDLVAIARRLVASGDLPVNAGVNKIQKALGCGPDRAAVVQAALRDQSPSS